MKDIRPALRMFLLADPALSAAVGGSRIYPVLLPQQPITLPSLVLTRVSGLGDHHMEGPSGLARPRYQIDAWAVNADLANTLADLTKDRIDGYRGPMSSTTVTIDVQGVFFDSEHEDYDDIAKLFRVRRDYFIWYGER